MVKRATPPPHRSFGIMAVAGNSRQIFAGKRVRDKISETNELDGGKDICCFRDISLIVLHSRKRCQGNRNKFSLRSAEMGSLLPASASECECGRSAGRQKLGERPVCPCPHVKLWAEFMAELRETHLRPNAKTRARRPTKLAGISATRTLQAAYEPALVKTPTAARPRRVRRDSR